VEFMESPWKVHGKFMDLRWSYCKKCIHLIFCFQSDSLASVSLYENLHSFM